MGLFNRKRERASNSSDSNMASGKSSEAMGSSAPPAPAAQGAGGFAPPSYDESQAASSTGGFKAYPTLPPNQAGVNYNQAPPPMAAPPGAAPTGVTASGQPVIVQYVNPPNFGPSSVNMHCPHCQCQVRTQTDSEPGPLAWILAGVLCVVGLWPCACIPCCIDSLNSVTHKCPSCKNFLGRYKGGM